MNRRDNCVERDYLQSSIGFVQFDGEVGFTIPIFEQGTPLPAIYTNPLVKSKLLSTDQDGQTNLKVALVMGESVDAVDNQIIGELIVDGIEPAPRGREVEVIFELDYNGIFSITAKELPGGKKLETRTTNYADPFSRRKRSL